MARICVSQLHLDIERPQVNLDLAHEAIAMASQSNAQLVVLPELVNSGYMFNNLDEVRERATTLDGAVIQGWVELAKDLRIIIVAGLALHVENKFLNASVVVDESGLRGWYAKAHLFGDEPKFFQPGNSTPLILDTSIGRIATMVCYDIEFPEWSRLAMLKGAQLIALPTNWPKLGDVLNSPPLEVVKSQANASMNKVVVAAADRVGVERGQEWFGASHITDFDGNLKVIAKPDFTGPIQNLIAEVELPTDTRIAISNDVKRDRRPELYEGLGQ